MFETVEGSLTNKDDPVICRFREQYRNKVDLIFSIHALLYVAHLQAKAAFLAFRDLLKPGTGKLYRYDPSREDPRSYFPVYNTQEKCETYYKWGQLGKQIWKAAICTISEKGGTRSTKNAIGVAKKNA